MAKSSARNRVRALWTGFIRRLRGARSTNADVPESLREAVKALDRWLDERKIGHAVIGGLALAAHGVVRATRGSDLLVEASGADALHEHLTALGFETVSRSEDVATYLLGRLRVGARSRTHPRVRSNSGSGGRAR